METVTSRPSAVAPAKEPEFGLTLSLLGVGGDARLSFTKDHIRMTWEETTMRERRMMKSLITRARKANLEVCTVDPDGKPDTAARGKDLPGGIKRAKAEGEVLIQGNRKAIAEIATALVEEEIKDGSLVMEAQQDGSWKLLSAESNKKAAEEAEKKGKKRELQSSRAVGGG